jgi:hypothetical protein
MGYKKIQEKRAQLAAQVAVKSAFVDAAQSLEDVLGNVEKTKQQVSQKVGALKTGGISELEAYKTSLLAFIGKLEAAKPPSLDPVIKMADAADKEMKAMMSAWEDKLAASCPKDVKPGMTFKQVNTQRIYEIKSPPQKATNPNLTGDQAIFFDGDWYKDGVKAGSSQTKLADLKKMKYIHTV